jgi:hypothetical protein
MKCIASFSENHLYKIKLAKTRVNALNQLYRRPPIKREPVSDQVANPRLRLRFREAIEEAQEVCEKDLHSEECHWAWDVVDELEDALMRR